METISEPITADVVIPVTTVNKETYLMATVAMRTCRASTSFPIHVWDNNSPADSKWRGLLAQECALLGVDYQFIPQPFSASRYLNMALDTMQSKYVAYCNSDVIFFHHWLENIIELWEENPKFFMMVNYTFDIDPGHPCAKTSGTMERKVVPTQNPSSGVMVMRREMAYRFDERFKFWEMDADFSIYLTTNKLFAGVCMNARCDHLICGIRDYIRMEKHMGIEGSNYDFYESPKSLLRKKWGMDYKG